MKRITIIAAALLLAWNATAQEAKTFRTIKELPITSVKNQYRSGTCWDFGTLGYLESEILRKTGRTYDLCEMFVVNKDYMDNATHYVRMHGYSQISEGGSCGDVSGDFLRREGLAYLPEGVVPSQELRQEQWDDWRMTYDHVMLIYGKAADEKGIPYYMVKNTWGKSGPYQGIWYMSRDYIALNTTYIFLNRHALPRSLRKALR